MSWCFVTELEWTGEAACAGWVDWQLWAHTGQTHDAGDRTTVSERLHLTAAQRGKCNPKMKQTGNITGNQIYKTLLRLREHFISELKIKNSLENYKFLTEVNLNKKKISFSFWCSQMLSCVSLNNTLSFFFNALKKSTMQLRFALNIFN